jgi:ribosomal subunit interface protein
MANYPLQITIRDIPQSDTVQEKIQTKAEKLCERYCAQITNFKVVAEYEKKHQNHGKLYKVTVDVNIPSHTLVATKSHGTLYIAIREAFRSIKRQLDDQMQIRHGETKVHAELQNGRIARVFDDFGFIEDKAGNEFYFHADNVVHPKFARLDIDAPVHFIAHFSKRGAQAHRVSSRQH